MNRKPTALSFPSGSDLGQTAAAVPGRGLLPFRLRQVTDAARGDLNINRTAIGGIPAGEQTFTYDPTGNCPSAARNDPEFHSASLRAFCDASASCQWQRTTTAEASVETPDQSRVHNQDNQLTQIDGSNSGILYDRAGNALRMPPTRLGNWAQHYRLTWDAWNRLVRIEGEDEFAPPVAEYTYDGAFRRITVTNAIHRGGGDVVGTCGLAGPVSIGLVARDLHGGRPGLASLPGESPFRVKRDAGGISAISRWLSEARATPPDPKG